MPGGNGTGPAGQGSYTGRSQHGELGFRRTGGKRFVGRGLGRGNGHCVSMSQSKESLAEEKQFLENRIKIIDSILTEK